MSFLQKLVTLSDVFIFIGNDELVAGIVQTISMGLKAAVRQII